MDGEMREWKKITSNNNSGGSSSSGLSLVCTQASILFEVDGNDFWVDERFVAA